MPWGYKTNESGWWKDLRKMRGDKSKEGGLMKM